jgi:CENP-B N-terminal DNA-binding domain.
MASTYTKVSKQGTTGKTKHLTSTIPQKLQIIRKLHSGKVQREVMVSYNIGSSTTYGTKKQKDQL